MDVWIIFFNVKTTKRKKKGIFYRNIQTFPSQRECANYVFNLFYVYFFLFEEKTVCSLIMTTFVLISRFLFLLLVSLPPPYFFFFFILFCLFNLSFLLPFHIHTRNGASVYTYITLKNLFLCHPALSCHKISWKCVSLSFSLSIHIHHI